MGGEVSIAVYGALWETHNHPNQASTRTAVHIGTAASSVPTASPTLSARTLAIQSLLLPLSPLLPLSDVQSAASFSVGPAAIDHRECAHIHNSAILLIPITITITTTITATPSHLGSALALLTYIYQLLISVICRGELGFSDPPRPLCFWFSSVTDLKLTPSSQSGDM